MTLPVNGQLRALAGRFPTDAALAAHLGVPRTTLRDHIARIGARGIVNEARGKTEDARGERPGMTRDGDEAVITDRPTPELRTPEDLMRDRGLDPADWTVKSLVVNEWDALAHGGGDDGEPRIVTMRQLKLFLVRRVAIEFVSPAVETTYRAPQKFRRPTDSRLVVICGDQQAPYQDPHMHEMFRQWLARNRPHEGVLLGDTVDFPTISRHRDNPEWHVSAQECINAGYLVLRDYVRASEGTRWRKLLGNHDERIRTELLNRAERLYGIRPADVPGEPRANDALSLRVLLHLDALGIELIEPRGNYTHAQVVLSPQLGVRHGWLTGANTAEKSLKALSYSLLVGHTHKQSVAHRTFYDPQGKPSVLQGVETGCMCRLAGGLGYAVDPSWVNGFATASVWPDGRFQIDLAKYADGVLSWRKQRFS